MKTTKTWTQQHLKLGNLVLCEISTKKYNQSPANWKEDKKWEESLEEWGNRLKSAQKTFLKLEWSGRGEKIDRESSRIFFMFAHIEKV